jgi:glucuronosyltransferase
VNIERLAKLVDDVPMKSPEKALWYIEYVIRNKGAKHLRYPQKEIPFYQYHYYDIFLSCVVLLALFLLLFYGLIKVTAKYVKRVMNLKSKKDKCN